MDIDKSRDSGSTFRFARPLTLSDVLCRIDAGCEGRIVLASHVESTYGYHLLDSGDYEYEPDLSILRRIRRPLTPESASPVIAAIALGRQRTSVADLASSLCVSTRALEYSLSRRWGIGPRQLLGWGTTLHSLWRADVMGWPLKRCAAAAGFGDGETLARFVHRYSGVRPTHDCTGCGFDWGLRVFGTLMNASADHQR